jgi:hypothetical protein
MSNKRLKKKLELEKAWKKAQSQMRHIDEDVHVGGIGIRRVQVCYYPSFEDGFSWDIREQDNSYVLFESDIISDELLIRLKDYRKIEIEHEILGEYFEEIKNVDIPISPIFNNMTGADGEIFQVALFGDMHSDVRFTWWSEYPDNWKPIVQPTQEIVQLILDHRIKS